ncbi:hypothetical protein [Caldimonas brevitalea]|uniref:Uncharacterized protein n=1 Tax=Caldimonas brevitalea TaxID=413882 RepID=A0A0G3BQM5_9BURK|nr:hypothetical protein [Caldimonas brevitalea]AKJ28815.1 hypothetical protein AAW51_2124 [Caldimonas brevitalea]
MKLLASTETVLVSAQSLDSLWHEAEHLGKVSVDSTWGDAYRVRICFDRKSGTTVWAEGRNTKIEFALADAINEAREMGAG